MNQNLVKFLLTGCMAGLATTYAVAWDGTGHMLVTLVARERLSATARQKVDTLAARLEEKGVAYNGASLACWPDDIKAKDSTSPFKGLFKPWHYIDIGCRRQDPDALAEMHGLKTTDGDVITAINHCVTIIRTGKTDALVPQQEVALALLMHFVGDIHQPLHTTARFNPDPKPGDKYKHDAGGNGVSLANLTDTPWPKNLHTFWDEAYRRFFADGQIKATPELAEADVLTSPAAKEWLRRLAAYQPGNPKLDFDAQAWALEAHAIACDHVYGQLSAPYGAQDVVLSRKYVEDSVEIARRQLVLAGYRLAALLNELYGD